MVNISHSCVRQLKIFFVFSPSSRQKECYDSIAIVRGEKRHHEKESTLMNDNASLLPASSSAGSKCCCNSSNDPSMNEAIASHELLQRIGRSSITPDKNSSCEEVCYSSEDKEISHIRQSETWDCGLTCLQMILQWLRTADEGGSTNTTASSLEAEKAWMIKYVATKSIWTIDLVMLLEYYSLPCYSSHNKTLDEVDDTYNEQSATTCSISKHKISYLFCSTNFGVDESYNKLGYYKDSFSSDELRVRRLFEIAQKRQWSLLQTSHIALHTFVDVVSKEGVVAIVLLDNRVLKGNTATLQQQQTRSSYSGHYVIICGVSRNENDINYAQMNSPNYITCDYCLVIKNPGISKQVQFITPSIFEKARRAKGTDEDVIFIIKRHNNAVRCDWVGSVNQS